MNRSMDSGDNSYEAFCNDLIDNSQQSKTSTPERQANQQLGAQKPVKWGIAKGVRVPVTLSFVESLTEIYLHLDANIPLLDRLQKALNEICPEQETLCNPLVGDLCAVKKQGKWQRALVLSRHRMVQYIDHGKTAVVNERMVRIPQTYCDLEPLTARCILDGVKQTDKWSPKDTKALQAIFERDGMTAECVYMIDGQPCVALYDARGRSLASNVLQVTSAVKSGIDG